MDDNMNPSIITDADKVGSKRYQNKNLTNQLNLTYDIPGIQGLTAKGLFNVDYGVSDNNTAMRTYSLIHLQS
jgi:hypothetical protein